ncbi:hypothetical protein AB0D57_23510 [Streptomyces sp. NPDC048275]|uniref:hypothetical protein n=1 Tax=Streptomyces sp. NPDC048275 TaxID=3155629 RepID=UPI0033E5CA56
MATEHERDGEQRDGGGDILVANSPYRDLFFVPQTIDIAVPDALWPPSPCMGRTKNPAPLKGTGSSSLIFDDSGESICGAKEN